MDGSFNHAVMVSTRQTNAGDSAASNIGFRCAGGPSSSAESDNDDVKRPKPRKKKEGSRKSTDGDSSRPIDDSLVIEL